MAHSRPCFKTMFRTKYGSFFCFGDTETGREGLHRLRPPSGSATGGGGGGEVTLIYGKK